MSLPCSPLVFCEFRIVIIEIMMLSTDHFFLLLLLEPVLLR